jgi:hypothetical protein
MLCCVADTQPGHLQLFALGCHHCPLCFSACLPFRPPACLPACLQDSHELRDELEMLRHSLEHQMSDNTAAVHDLELMVRQLMSLQGLDVSPSARAASVVAAAAVAPPPTMGQAGSRPSTPGSGGPPGSSELLDQEDKMLLERINHLASDLSEEMKEAVQELELQQQSLLERHQHIIADLSLGGNSNNSNNKNRMSLDLGFGAGLGMRMQPTMGGSMNGVLQAGPHVTRAVARWLESRNVQQYHQGLLVAVLISCGLWRDSMWEQLEGGALRWVCRHDTPCIKTRANWSIE